MTESNVNIIEEPKLSDAVHDAESSADGIKEKPAHRDDDIKALTPAQRKVLNFIHTTIKTEHISPTLREITDKFGWSALRSSVVKVNRLIELGWLEHSDSRATRKIVLTRKAQKHYGDQ